MLSKARAAVGFAGEEACGKINLDVQQWPGILAVSEVAVDIRYVYDGVEQRFETDHREVIIGRPGLGKTLDLDLTPDRAVSRQHAKLWVESDQIYIQDMGSHRGTLVNGEEIKGLGIQRVEPGQTIVVGQTELHVSQPAPASVASEVAALWMDAPGKITDSVDASSMHVKDLPVQTQTASRRMEVLCELPVQMNEQTDLGALFDLLLERVMELVPDASQAAVLLKDDHSHELLLKAFKPGKRPVVSTTVCKRAVEQMEAVIWSADVSSGDAPASIEENAIQSALAVPLVWKRQVLGVLSVNICNAAARFEREDLALMAAVGQYAAGAVANHWLQDRLRLSGSVLRRLLVTFSPKVREHLMKEAVAGRLRPGGTRAEVTILCADIRNFVGISRDMDTEDIVDLLNAYFSALVHTVFQHDGTIDKFVGDSILAVFGSPQQDDGQHAKAIEAAVAMQGVMGQVTEERVRRGQTTCKIGIGVHCGEVLHGFIGSSECMEFTVIGDAVNLATRLCDGAEPGQILISPQLYERVWRLVEAEKIEVPTKHEGQLTAYRLTAWRRAE